MHALQSFLAPAKLNLFLHIVGQRDDGYHLLQSVFQLIDLSDTISLGVREDNAINHLNPIPNVPAEQDLTVKAAKLLRSKVLERQPDAILGADIQVKKKIPMGGGLLVRNASQLICTKTTMWCSIQTHTYQLKKFSIIKI